MKTSRVALDGGQWQPGMVRRWQKPDAPRITAPPAGPEVHARLATLSKAESNVLRLLACGHTPEEVATIRSTAIKTVYAQIRGISKKLDLTWTASYATAVALAWRAGWITVAAPTTTN